MTDKSTMHKMGFVMHFLALCRQRQTLRSCQFGVRWQSVAATPLFSVQRVTYSTSLLVSLSFSVDASGDAYWSGWRSA